MTHRIASLIRRFPFIIRIPFLIYRQFQPRYTVGVVGILFNEVGHVLIVEHVFHPENPWGLPGGWIERNEQPTTAVLRELEEELQLKARIKQVIYVEKNFKNHLDIAFLCEATTGIGELSHELLNYKWLDPDDLPGLHPFHQQAIDVAKSLYQRS